MLHKNKFPHCGKRFPVIFCQQLEKMTCEEMWERGEGVFPDADKEARI